MSRKQKRNTTSQDKYTRTVPVLFLAKGNNWTMSCQVTNIGSNKRALLKIHLLAPSIQKLWVVCCIFNLCLTLKSLLKRYVWKGRPHRHSESGHSYSKCSRWKTDSGTVGIYPAELMESEMREMRTRCVWRTGVRLSRQEGWGVRRWGGGWVCVLPWPKQRASRSRRGEEVRQEDARAGGSWLC